MKADFPKNTQKPTKNTDFSRFMCCALDQDDASYRQVGTKLAEVGPNLVQVGFKLAQVRHKLVQDGAELA